jgi:hypothetical protein
MSETRVVNCRTEKFDVFIGRPSRWGNPYSHQTSALAMFRVRTREEAIAAYATWILQQPELLAELPTLKGKILGCYCRPSHACHGDVLARMADGLYDVTPVERAAEPDRQMALPGAD